MLFRLSGSLPHCRNGRRLRYWAASYSGLEHLLGAQYREATRAKSNADFISKIEGSLQELEETEYWLELLGESGFFPKDGLAAVRKETGELKGIFVSIVINTKAKSKPRKS